jgi:hypothetical protein
LSGRESLDEQISQILDYYEVVQLLGGVERIQRHIIIGKRNCKRVVCVGCLHILRHMIEFDELVLREINWGLLLLQNPPPLKVGVIRKLPLNDLPLHKLVLGNAKNPNYRNEGS